LINIIFTCNFNVYLIFIRVFTLWLSFFFNVFNTRIIWKLWSFLRNLLIGIFFFWFIIFSTLKITIKHLCLIIVLNHLLSKLAKSLMSEWVYIKKFLYLWITLLIFFKLRCLRWSDCLKFDSIKDTALQLRLILRLILNIIIKLIKHIWNILLRFLCRQIYWLHFY